MSTITAASRPGLRPGVRLVRDDVRGQLALLYPEGVLLLNESAAEVVLRCTGGTVADIAEDLATEYDDVAVDEIVALVADLAARRLVVGDGTGRPVPPAVVPASTAEPRSPVPLGLLAELTYRCPLHCTYCSNPLELAAYRDELSTEDWLAALDAAARLGVLQVHFSGGEPLLRPDLAVLVAHANRLGLYTNLVTSGIPLAEKTLAALVDAGLDHLQLSIQDADAVAADAVAGLRAHDRKLVTARVIRRYGLPLTVNVVLHAGNLGRLPEIAALGVALGADRVELAHTQFYGWGWRNRAALLPSREQMEQATRDILAVRERYGDTVELVYVAADYHGDRPKPCMYGWGNRQLVIAPNGDVLPCLAAAQLPDLGVENVRTAALGDIWYSSPSFNRFRGTDWMPEPCRSCALREVDFGGCRCQAYQILGDAAQTDPACGLSPRHGLMAEVVSGAERATERLAMPRRAR